MPVFGEYGLEYVLEDLESGSDSDEYSSTSIPKVLESDSSPNIYGGLGFIVIYVSSMLQTCTQIGALGGFGST